jgi:hypothetical protein
MNGLDVPKARALAALSAAFMNTTPRTPRVPRTRPVAAPIAAPAAAPAVTAVVAVSEPSSEPSAQDLELARMLAGWQVLGSSR